MFKILKNTKIYQFILHWQLKRKHNKQCPHTCQNCQEQKKTIQLLLLDISKTKRELEAVKTRLDILYSNQRNYREF